MLAKIEAFLIQMVIQFLTTWITATIARQSKLGAIKNKAETDRAERDNAKTPEEKAKAAQDTARDTFS